MKRWKSAPIVGVAGLLALLGWWVKTEGIASAASPNTEGAANSAPFVSAAGPAPKPISLESTNQAPTLVIQGDCPGTMTVAAEGLSPHGGVLVYRGTGPGNTDLTGLCNGTTIELADAHRVEEFEADASGELQVTRRVPAAACGDYLQLVDVCTCSTTNISPV